MTDEVQVEKDRGYAEAESMLRDLLTPDLISDTAIRVARDHMMQFSRATLQRQDERVREIAHYATGLECRVRELFAALKPFARQNPHKNEDGDAGVLVPATVADVRLARLALAGPPAPGPRSAPTLKDTTHE